MFQFNKKKIIKMPSLHPGALGNHPIQIPPDFPPILKAYTKVRSCMYNLYVRPQNYTRTGKEWSLCQKLKFSNFYILQPDGVNP